MVAQEPPTQRPITAPRTLDDFDPYGATPFNDFVPFDDVNVDFYSFEVSDLEVYNFEIFTNAADARLRGGQNDVLEIVGRGSNSSGIAVPQRVGQNRVAIGATVGVQRDDDGIPILDGIIEGQTLVGIQIDAVKSNGDRHDVGERRRPTRRAATGRAARREQHHRSQPGIRWIDGAGPR